MQFKRYGLLIAGALAASVVTGGGVASACTKPAPPAAHVRPCSDRGVRHDPGGDYQAPVVVKVVWQFPGTGPRTQPCERKPQPCEHKRPCEPGKRPCEHKKPCQPKKHEHKKPCEHGGDLA